MKRTPISREEAVIVGKRFAVEMKISESRALAAAEAWFDAKHDYKSRDEQALREYLKVRFA